jgi:hypothetical protein
LGGLEGDGDELVTGRHLDLDGGLVDELEAGDAAVGRAGGEVAACGLVGRFGAASARVAGAGVTFCAGLALGRAAAEEAEGARVAVGVDAAGGGALELEGTSGKVGCRRGDGSGLSRLIGAGAKEECKGDEACSNAREHGYHPKSMVPSLSRKPNCTTRFNYRCCLYQCSGDHSTSIHENHEQLFHSDFNQ